MINSPKNSELKRFFPSISIRAQISVSFSLFFILCLAITIWSYLILSKLENKIDFLEISDNYMVEIQQARRFEKNFLLYSTDFDDALEHLRTADNILTRHSKTIENMLGKEHFTKLVLYMSKYHEQLFILGKAGSEVQKKAIVPKLRQYGSQMVSFAEEIVKRERSDVARMLLLAKRVPFFFMLVLLVLGIIIIMSLVRRLLVTLNRFMEYTKRIGEGNFSPILSVKKFGDEFSHLAEAFNRMIEELNHRHNILLESHKIRAIGTLVAGVAHELNNPLNNTLLTASMLKEDFKTLEESEKFEMIDDLINETERSQRIVKDLLDFARESETNIKALKLDAIVNDSIRLVANQIRIAKITMEVNIEKDLPTVHGDEQMLKQVFVNLILNAVDMLLPRGRIGIDVQKDKRQGYLSVKVADNGPGIPEHIQSRIFEPFFTTKKHGRGTGLGLSVSRGIIRKLGGYIDVVSKEDTGTTFTVLLPITDSPSEIMSK